jgi:hypothetical protein
MLVTNGDEIIGWMCGAGCGTNDDLCDDNNELI